MANQPDFIPSIWGVNNSTVETIPATTTEAGKASWDQGFPIDTGRPLSQGGLPPRYGDFNGVLNALSQFAVYAQTGGQYAWSATIDYAAGCIVKGTDGNLYRATTASGPSSTAVNPVVDTSGKWSKIVGQSDLDEIEADVATAVSAAEDAAGNASAAQSAVSTLDANVVKLSGNQTVGGIKTFTGNISVQNNAPGINVADTSFAKGDTIATSQYDYINFGGSDLSTSNVTKLGAIGVAVHSDSINLNILGFKNESGSSDYAGIRVVYPNSGTPYATAPQTPSGSTGSEIVTANYLSSYAQKTYVDTEIADIEDKLPKRLIDVTRMYVDGVNGNDDNDGTQASPWKTMDRFFQMLNEGYDDIRCNIVSGGIYYVHTADVIEGCAIHITATASSPVQVWFVNESGSITLYNLHLNLYSSSASNRLVVGAGKYINGVEDITQMGNCHADNSLITIRRTDLKFKSFNFYSDGVFFSDASFYRMVLFNSQFRANKLDIQSHFVSTTESEEEVETDDRSANILAYNSSLYISAGISAVERTGGTAKFMECYGCDIFLGRHVYPTPVEQSVTDLNLNYTFYLNGCKVQGSVFDTPDGGTESFWQSSLGQSRNGAYILNGAVLRGGGIVTEYDMGGKPAGVREISAGYGTADGGSLSLVGLNAGTNPGSFALCACGDGSSTTSAFLRGQAQGTAETGYLSWDGTFQIAGHLKKNRSNSVLYIYSGSTSSCSSLYMYGPSHATHPGEVTLRSYSANNGTPIEASMILQPDGTATWNGQPIQTASDARMKTELATVPDDVLDAWGDVGWGQFQYLAAIEKKGADARLHLGLIAQRVKDAFEARGLDACGYGVLCHATWDDEYDGGELVRKGGEMWTVRYAEALAMEAAYQRRRADRAEARITALEQRLGELEAALASLISPVGDETYEQDEVSE